MNTIDPHKTELHESPRPVTKTYRTILVSLYLSLSLLPCVNLHAEQKYDPRTLAMLPTYCKYTLAFRQSMPENNIPEEVERWTNLMGSTFGHMHHYCWGLIDTNNAMLFAKNRQERMMYLQVSIKEFDYVIKNATPDFVLLPEILNRKGQNLILLSKAPLAIPVLQHAIALKADYWPPYASLSDYYKEAGDLVKARQWLEKGLSASPDARALQRRLSELGKGNGKRGSQGSRLERPAAPSADKASAHEQARSAEHQEPVKRD